MRTHTSPLLAPLLALLLLTAACAAKEPAPAPEPEPTGPAARVVLLADPDGTVGAVTVRARSGSVRLDKPLTAVSVTRELELSDPFALSLQQVEQEFGPVLRAMPEPPERFLLYFRGKTKRLTRESSKLLADIEKAVKRRDSRDISIVGHTDTIGDHDYNMIVSTNRAEAVATELEKRGISREIMETTSHGENNPIVPTGDGKAHPENRRVEVIIR